MTYYEKITSLQSQPTQSVIHSHLSLSAKQTGMRVTLTRTLLAHDGARREQRHKDNISHTKTENNQSISEKGGAGVKYVLGARATQ